MTDQPTQFPLAEQRSGLRLRSLRGQIGVVPVDTIALERVLGTNSGGRVSFRYQGLLVAADADGTVEVYDQS